MGRHNDSSWAQDYLVNPLTAPVPSEETGPGTRFRSTFQTPSNDSIASSTHSSAVRDLEHEFAGPANGDSNNPFHRAPTGGRTAGNAAANGKPAHGGNGPYITPPSSASPHATGFDEARQGTSPGCLRRQRSHSHSGIPRPPLPHADAASPPRGSAEHHRRTRSRGDTLSGRYPGDQSHQPLAILRSDSKRAHRAAHLQKQHQPRPDLIDQLDVSTGAPYHHDGPFDATLAARNVNVKHSPLEAVRGTNEEALRAVPPEQVMDAVAGHQPLSGVAAVPPGELDPVGRRMNYKEGENLMTEGENAYKRWPGVEYRPEDHKGKGEPQFSEDLQEHARINYCEPLYDERGIPQEPPSGSGHRDEKKEVEITVHSSETHSRRPLGEGLRRKLGSLRRKME